MQILFTEGRVVGPRWDHLKPEGPKGQPHNYLAGGEVQRVARRKHPLGPLGSSSSQHRRTPELVLQKSHASFRITFTRNRKGRLGLGGSVGEKRPDPCAGTQTQMISYFSLGIITNGGARKRRCECNTKHQSTKAPRRVIRKEAWPFCRISSGVRLWWELKEPTGPNGR
jgi:hypothetical protein